MSPAAAVTVQGSNACAINAGASACFIADGDLLRVCDERADGHGAYGQLAWNGIINRTTRADGVGNCASAGGNIAEGTAVQVRVCLIKAGVLYSCSGWKNGVA